MLSILQSIILTSSIPSELVTRKPMFTFEIGVALFVSFLLIAFARLARPQIYVAIGVGLLKVNGIRAHIRETFPLNKRGSIFLLVNYVLTTALVVYLWLESFGTEKDKQIIYAIIAPMLLLFGSITSLKVTGWLTGEEEVLKAPIIMKIIGAQAIGLIYFACALIWILNPSLQNSLVQVVIWSFIVENGIRILKSILVVYNQGVSWYYIILYFCTLEILPLFVVYYFVLRKFVDQ